MLATGQSPDEIEVDATHVYWTDVGRVMKVPSSGGVSTTLATTTPGYSLHIGLGDA